MEDFLSNIFSKFKGLKQSTKRNIALAGYGSALVVALLTIGISYQPPVDSDISSGNQALIDDVRTTVKPSTNSYMDQVAEAELALGVAENAGLSVTNNVMEHSASLAIREEMAQTESESVTKPIITSGSTTSAIVNYVTVNGDSVPSLAVKFAVSEQTIKWANNLTSDALNAGSSLAIPSVDGVVYTVKDGDTLQSIADKYGSNQTQILAVNDIDDIVIGERIVIPNGNLPENERPGYVAPSTTTSTAATTVSSSISYTGVSAGSWTGFDPTVNVGNRYAAGYCTYYAYYRRAQLGRPIGSFWGNAATWAYAASAAGFVVNNTPAPGAIFQYGGGYGHVGIVESVDFAAGTMLISDMNGIAGWGNVGYATVSINSGWNYIH